MGARARHRPPPEGIPELPIAELEQEVVALARTWDDALRERLVERARAGPRARAQRPLGAALPAVLPAPRSPRRSPSPTSSCLERLEGEGQPFLVGLQNEPSRTRVALYKTGGKVELADAMPTLEHLGLRVIEEVPTRLRGGDGDTWVQDFGVLGPDDRPLDLADGGRARGRLHRGRPARRRRVRHAEPPRRRGRARLAPGRRAARLPDVPPAHRLALHAGLPERRAGGQPGAHGEADALLRAALRPGAARATPTAEAALREEILADLDAVTSLDHDRILRNQLGLIDATLRTNAFRPDRDGDRLQAALGRRAGDPAARAAVRDLRLLAGAWRASTCAAARSRAAASAGRTARTTARRSTA